MNGWMRRCLTALLMLTVVGTVTPVHSEVVQRTAKDTLTALEMDHGDELEFRLRNGRVVSLLLEWTDAGIVEQVEPGGIVYQFSATFRIAGQRMRLQRYVCCQECFYEPWVVNGLRIWLDTVRDVFDVIPVRYPRKGNLQCVPRKAARLAVQDATLRICPDEVRPWIEHDAPTLDVGDCYNGDDCYLGPYLGKACHVGMDINHPKGSVLFAPIRFDTQAYFDSVAAGDNNNRWRGIRRWPNGDVWALQSHHLIDLLVAENTPLESGVKYATTAGVHVGSHEHTHFEFKVGRRQDSGLEDAASIAAPIDFDDESELAQERPEVLHLDPWIVFWQAFEDQKEERGAVRAVMKPLEPARVGEVVRFSAVGSRPGPDGDCCRYFWTFGDSGSTAGPMPSHTFRRPGVFPVRLFVDDGHDRDSTIQWIAVSGAPAREPSFALAASSEPSFRPWPWGGAETCGKSSQAMPNTIRFHARPGRQKHETRIDVIDTKKRSWPSGVPRLTIEESDWLEIEQKEHDGQRWLEVRADARELDFGTYSTSFRVTSPKMFLNGIHFSPWTHQVHVELIVSEEEPAADVTVDDADPGFYATPYFWVGHRFCRCPADRHGYGGFYMTNGGRARRGEFVRFTPDLQAGEYEVSLVDETPFSPGVEFHVRVRHADGEDTLRIRPLTSRTIGTFEFHEGMDGFVEILAEGSKGLVIADAVHFRKKQSSP